MKKKYSDTEYVYANARIHYAEGNLLTEEKYKKLDTCESTEEFRQILFECGYETKKYDIFTSVEKKLEENFDFASSLIKNSEILHIMRLPYECNNIKGAMKCSLVKGFDYENIFSACGISTLEQCEKAVKDNDYSFLYPHMKEACKGLIEKYAETKDPQMIDIPLDVACLEDMYDIAKDSKEKNLLAYVKDRIDILNVKNAIRLAEMMKDDDFADKVYIKNGDIDKKVIDEIREDVGNLSVCVKNTKFENLLQNTPKGFSDLERKFEYYLDNEMDKYRMSMFGCEPVLRYMYVCETESRRIRTLFSSLSSRLIKSKEKKGGRNE